MFQLITEPTRIMKKSRSRPYNNRCPGLFTSWEAETSISISDQLPIYGIFDMLPPKQSMSKFVWHYNKVDFIAINAELKSVDWEKASYEIGDLDQATDFLLNNMKASAYRHIGKKVTLNSEVRN